MTKCIHHKLGHSRENSRYTIEIFDVWLCYHLLPVFIGSVTALFALVVFGQMPFPYFDIWPGLHSQLT